MRFGYVIVIGVICGKWEVKMRPIDADALEKKLHDAIDVGRRADVSTAELEAVLADVENMPTLPGPALPESVKTFASCTSCSHAADSEDTVPTAEQGWKTVTSSEGDVNDRFCKRVNPDV